MEGPLYRRKSLLRRRAYKPRITFLNPELEGTCMKNVKPARKKEQTVVGRTNVPGQNPKQNDSPDHDENNDQNRFNLPREKQSN